MTNEEILEGNILIAQFMGATIEQWYPSSAVYNQTGQHAVYPKEGIFPDNHKHHPTVLLKYHSSWEWLMTVLNKIGDDSNLDKYLGMGCTLSLPNKQCQIFDNTQDWCYESEYGDTLLEATWKCILKFIKWYNSNANNEKGS